MSSEIATPNNNKSLDASVESDDDAVLVESNHDASVVSSDNDDDYTETNDDNVEDDADDNTEDNVEDDAEDNVEDDAEDNVEDNADDNADDNAEDDADDNADDNAKNNAEDASTMCDPVENLGRVLRDFLTDLLRTFPEIADNLDENLKNIVISEEEIPDKNATSKISSYCNKVFPEKFFDILYQNESMFEDSPKTPLYLLPGIDFKILWRENISDTTRSTIWRYLQLILFTVVADLRDSDSFGDTAKLFEAIDENAFKKKLEETIENMGSCFDKTDVSGNQTKSTGATGPLPNPEELHEHMSGMLNGKLGTLAKEIAEETAKDFDIDMNAKDGSDIFKKLFKNPTKLLGMIKKVGGKLDEKIKSGEIKESELLQEASEMMKKMKNMPGMNNMQNMFRNMGLNPTGPINEGLMQAQLNRSVKTAKQKERMREKLAARRKANEAIIAQRMEFSKKQQEMQQHADAVQSLSNENEYDITSNTKEINRDHPLPVAAAKKRRRRKKKSNK